MAELTFIMGPQVGTGEFIVQLALDGEDVEDIWAGRFWTLRAATEERERLNRILAEVGASVDVRPNELDTTRCRAELSIGGVGLPCLPMIHGPWPEVFDYKTFVESGAPTPKGRAGVIAGFQVMDTSVADLLSWAIVFDGAGGYYRDPCHGGTPAEWGTREEAEAALVDLRQRIADAGLVVESTTNGYSVGLRTSGGGRQPIFEWLRFDTLGMALEAAVDITIHVRPYRTQPPAPKPTTSASRFDREPLV